MPAFLLLLVSITWCKFYYVTPISTLWHWNNRNECNDDWVKKMKCVHLASIERQPPINRLTTVCWSDAYFLKPFATVNQQLQLIYVCCGNEPATDSKISWIHQEMSLSTQNIHRKNEINPSINLQTNQTSLKWTWHSNIVITSTLNWSKRSSNDFFEMKSRQKCIHSKYRRDRNENS